MTGSELTDADDTFSRLAVLVVVVFFLSFLWAKRAASGDFGLVADLEDDA
jgi:hypothetical protein